MNEKLRCTPELAFREIPLGDQIIRFNGECGCVGIVRYAGGAYLETPEPINETTLSEVRKYSDLFKIDEPNDVSVTVPTAAPQPIEIPNSKTVVDAPEEAI